MTTPPQEPKELEDVLKSIRKTSFSDTGLFSFVMSDTEALAQLQQIIDKREKEARQEIIDKIRTNHQQKLMGLPTTSDIPFSPMYELTEVELEALSAKHSSKEQ